MFCYPGSHGFGITKHPLSRRSGNVMRADVLLCRSPWVRDNKTSALKAFRKLHESGCFVIPNPWDPGSARYLQHLGFKALATTSAGFAFSRGLPAEGGVVSRDAMLGNIAEVTAATELPVNADFQAGDAHTTETVGGNVRL